MINPNQYKDKKSKVIKEEVSRFAEGIRRVLERHHAGLFDVTVTDNGVRVTPASKEERLKIVEQLVDQGELDNVVELLGKLELTEVANREINNLAKITKNRIATEIMSLLRK